MAMLKDNTKVVEVLIKLNESMIIAHNLKEAHHMFLTFMEY